ncbi:MAG: hypothetical protein SGPRY_006957, partial [Prymnesium sp.]
MEEGRARSEASGGEADPQLHVARAIFLGGFAGLPLLWFVGWIHFREAAKQPHAPPALASYVRGCLVGSVFGGLLLLAWFITVSASWRSWGQFGRALML